MTRTVAREIAIQLSFAAQLAGDDARETADTFFSREYFATLAEEDPLFLEYPDEKQLDYIRRLTGLVYDHMYELNHMIEKYARGWRLERISRVAAAIMRCAMCEILYMDDVPNAAAINEAVELAKGYEEPETVAFINGVLGSFVRGEVEPEAEAEEASAEGRRLMNRSRRPRTAPKPDMARTSFTVTELNAHIKQLLDADALLGNVCVTGELSNYKVYPSGHHYFTLKDAESSLRCVMFRSSAQSLRFRPASGMSVAAIGRIAVYPRDGAYQLYCTRLIPGGVGDLYAAYEQLKEQLQKEGLFDRAHKKPLPLFPRGSLSSRRRRVRPCAISSACSVSAGRPARSCCCPCACRGRRHRRRSPERSGMPTAIGLATSSSPAAAAVRSRTCGRSMTNVSRGRSTIRISRSFPPSGTSRM